MSNGDIITLLTLAASASFTLLVYGAWFVASRKHTAMFDTILKFLDRPNGGIEVEIIYGSVELWFAIIFSVTSQAVANMVTTEDLYWSIPHYVLAAPWWLSSVATLIGLLLYVRGNRWCAPLRWLGALLSSWIWSMMLARGAVASGGALGSLAFYFFGAVWQVRIMMSAWRRWGGAWHWYAGP